MRRNIATAVLLGLLLSISPSSAAQRSLGLVRRLAALSANDSISVMLEFSDHPDLSRYHRRADGRPVIEALRSGAGRSQERVLAFLESRGLADRLQSFWINNSIVVRLPVAMLPDLEQFQELGRIEFDEPVTGDGVGTPGVWSTDWNIPMIRADQVWSTYGLDGTGIVVGSMDTGFDPSHPALAGKWRGGTNSWRDVVNSGATPYDDNGHGTHTIGTMVGGDGLGPFAFDVGVAYGAKFIAVKVLDAGNGFSSSSTVVAGAQWILDPDGNPATDDFPDVVNNSWLFFDATFQGFHAAVAAWRAVGIIPVFALGNNGPDPNSARPPGSYDNTIGVGATDISDAIASFSSRGPTLSGPGFPADQRKPDLSAPGVSVLSTYPGGSYVYFSGTSMASPHVAGTVALMLQAHPAGMSFDEVRAALIETAVDRGPVGYDNDFGYGRLDAFAAVTRAMSPSAHVTASATGHDVALAWNAVPSALHYDVYRSPEPQDLAPQLIGSTTGTTLADAHRFGRFYYRLKTVTGSGQSPFTNEAVVTACGMTGPSFDGTDGSTTSPVFGDFNGDGRRDVALASLPTGTVKVALGQPGGQFGPIASFAAGTRPSGVAVSDFNADGILDLAVTNNVTPGTVSIVLGHGSGGVGDGTFGAPVTYPTASRPVGIVCADFNQDGIGDLAVACNGGPSISILIGNGSGGNGDGTFAAAVSYATGLKPTGIVAADLDRDGALDLATAANGSARVSLLLGNRDAIRADGTFTVATPAFCARNPVALATGDFNGDGRTDLAVTCNAGPGIVSILLGRDASPGQSVLADGVDYAGGVLPQGIATVDLNGDGISDLAVADGSADGPIDVLLGTGSGSVGDGGFEKPTTFAPGGSPADLAVADLDGDGSPDLTIANVSSSQSLGVMLGSCGTESGTGLTLLAPNGGERWPISTTHTIAWSKGPGVIAVNIDVSRDNGATWRTIATQQTGASYDWTVTDPATPSASARIRIYDPRVSRADTSDAAWTIGPDFRLAVPSEGRIDAPALTVENPGRGGVWIRFHLGPRVPATLDVLDLSGRRVITRAIGDLGPGEHLLQLGRSLRPGMYLVRLVQGPARITRKAAIVR